MTHLITCLTLFDKRQGFLSVGDTLDVQNPIIEIFGKSTEI